MTSIAIAVKRMGLNDAARHSTKKTKIYKRRLEGKPRGVYALFQSQLSRNEKEQLGLRVRL